ncbi:hypothetical protein SOPP22_03260 [Shewanella sp. OPT22]|nr:hypothetical protein SOPP22_03260 [Shewanella sp. OPT22]
MRSLILANEIKKTWPNAEIKFILNRHTKYASTCPFETELLDNSPTMHTQEVNHIIEAFRPNVVVFDASGRQAQLAKAKSVGATTVFISQHAKKRRRGMKWKRARYTDFHFVAQPEFAIAPISWIQRIKFKLMNKPKPECVGIFFERSITAQKEHVLAKYDVQNKKYIIVSAGSGGHRKGDNVVADVFFKAAELLAKSSNIKTLIVMGPSYPNKLPKSDFVTVISKLNNAEFIALIDGAKTAVLSGGGALLQALALKVPVITCPVSKDQPTRIEACKSQGLVINTSLEQLVSEISTLTSDENLKRVSERLQSVTSQNGVDVVIEHLSKTLDD